MVSQAGLVSLRAGEERDGVDFALQLVPTARVEGHRVAPEGGAPRGTGRQLDLARRRDAGAAGRGTPHERRRSRRPVLVRQRAPGQYTVLARAARPITKSDGTSAGPPQTVWASTQIAVDGEPITGLSLSLEPGLTISDRCDSRARR
jgi:hypothetical protein